MGTSVISLKYSQGFSLLEVLVAIVISTILMGGAIMMLSSGKRVYAVQSELAQMQSNARFVIDEFNRELRIAGYFGCSGNPPTGEPTHPFQDSDNRLTAMKDINDKGGFPASDKVAINSFNQKITVDSAQIFSSGTTISFQLDENSDYWPKAGETIIVSDCTGSDRYKVTNNPTDTTEASRNMTFTQLDGSTGLSRNYIVNPEVFTGKTHIAYEVKAIAGGEFALYKTQCENIDQDPDPCDSDSDIVEEEIFIENVETLQVRYGFNIVLDDGVLETADGINDVLAFDDNGDNLEKLIPDFYDADYQPFCPPTDTDSDGTPDTYTFSCTPDTTTVIFPIVATRITLLMRTATKHYDQKQIITDKLFQLDPDDNSANIPYNPKTNFLESSYRHRMFTTVIAVRNARN